jgi:MSHA biogenesis protein MshP
MVSSRNNQQGFSVVMAVFIIVVLGMLAAAMIKFLAAGSESVAREIISARALMAADSGAQRTLNAIFPPGGVTDTSACGLNNYTFNGLEGCSNVAVAVTCNFVTVDAVNYFTIRSEGRCGPLSDQAVRVVEVQAKDGF